MRYSQLFSKTQKEVSADADSVNARLLTQAGFISKQMAGVYNYLPLGRRTLSKIENIIREEMLELGAMEILMPALSQIEVWKKTKRQDIDVLFHLKGQGDTDLVLNPTHEDIITPLVQRFVFSYRDLPFGAFQIQAKFRNEPRAKSGLLRGREFVMKDLYSFHADTKDRDSYYERVKQAYFKIYDRLGLGERTILTYASGGDFSKYSHEFQTFSEIGEDTIYHCTKCNVAVNREILDEQKTCPECGSSKITPKKAIEVGNIFKLGTRFSEAFGFKYKDQKGHEQLVEMASYGIGPSRIMGALVEVFHDDHGIIWPMSVSPYQVQLVTLGKESEVQEESKKIYEKLGEAEIEVLWDDRVDASAGEKFNDADLIGLPIRVLVSKKTLEQKSAEVKKRADDEAKLVPLKGLIRRLVINTQV